MRIELSAFLFVLGLGAWSCADAPGVEAGSELDLRLSVAGVGQLGVGVACFDLELRSAAGTVWALGDRGATRLGSTQPYVHAPDWQPDRIDEATVCVGQEAALALTAACDPSADLSDEPGIQNALLITLDGVYERGPDAAMPTRHIDQDEMPCTAGCTALVECRADAPTQVDVQITLGRVITDRGFFDTVVGFGGSMCLAGLATAEILHGADGERVPTAILRSACGGVLGEAGLAGRGFELAPLALDCDGHALPLAMLGHGLQDEGPLAYAIYAGTEPLGGSIESRYWTFALDLDQLEGLGDNCRIEHVLTAEVPEPSPGRARVLIHPVLRVAAALTRDGLATHAQGNLEDPNGIVHLEYRGDALEHAPLPLLCYRHDGEPRALTERAGCEEAR